MRLCDKEDKAIAMGKAHSNTNSEEERGVNGGSETKLSGDDDDEGGRGEGRRPESGDGGGR